MDVKPTICGSSRPLPFSGGSDSSFGFDPGFGVLGKSSKKRLKKHLLFQVSSKIGSFSLKPKSCIAQRKIQQDVVEVNGLFKKNLLSKCVKKDLLNCHKKQNDFSAFFLKKIVES